ncbi:endonuclease-reverse transcriptase [Trichonephila clavipes]|uniref:Endonuclease-reverse transcriptase n=1 Tax=Trichonephila clavipes TaxID=2585209 RepID=A0A8X6WFR1_TRICX|nr:endonuclease-reverse transcriptase [Trichonephila clavipes]
MSNHYICVAWKFGDRGADIGVVFVNITRLYEEPQVTQVIRSNRLRWLGHIWRSPENNQTRAYTFKNPMGSRTRGRPPTRWIDYVENDLKTLNIKNWQRVAAYRWNWRKRAVEAAKTCNSQANRVSSPHCLQTSPFWTLQHDKCGVVILELTIIHREMAKAHCCLELTMNWDQGS